MSWRLSVVHRSGYTYATPVQSSYNEARVTPLTTPTQLVLEATLEVQPPAKPFRYWDYWGTAVHAFDLHTPHTDLLVTGRSLVETQAAPRRPAISWSELRTSTVSDHFAELLAPTGYVPSDDALVAAVVDDIGFEATPMEAVDHAVAWVRDEMVYEPGVTGVHTSALEALKGGRGVCQDFAHLTLAVLRRAGIPARYASGYVHPVVDAAIGEKVVGESHAWVEVWTGDWWGVDPTNGVSAGERHVLVARGRDYADVPPLKGIYHGGASHALHVEVAVTRLA
jgi:transglutaminase-like putative cysteine protease